MTKGDILLVGLAVVGIFLLASVIGIVYFYRRTMIRQNAKMERTVKMAGTDWSQYKEMLTTRKRFMLKQKREDVYIQSFDNLKLHGVYFPAIDKGANSSDEKSSGAKKLVICLHGYTSQSMQDFTGLTDYYFRNGFAMLQPDARAHGTSEGKYIGFGCLDRKDLIRWIDWVIDYCGADTEIYLHGISMGGATVLMASGMELPTQVKGIVSDCAFTSPKEVFTHVLKTMYHLPAFPLIPAANIVNKIFAGYGTDECNARREVAKAKLPILFIHGGKDTFVPARMCQELYQSCASAKKILLIEEAAHGESYYKDTAEYEAALDDFYSSVKA